MPRSPRSHNRCAGPVSASPTPKGLVAAALRLSLEAGTPVRRSTVRLVVDAGFGVTGQGPAGWSPGEVAEIAWVAILDWCQDRQVPVPEDAADALEIVVGLTDNGSSRWAMVTDLVGVSSGPRRVSVS